jgi:serine/threonine protein kinase
MADGIKVSSAGEEHRVYFTLGSSASSAASSTVGKVVNWGARRDGDDEEDTDDEVMVIDEVRRVDSSSSSSGGSNSSSSLSLEDFDLVSTIGKGGFGRVFLVQPRASVVSNALVQLDPSSFYALKTIRKSRLAVNRTELKHTLSEHRALQAAGDHPFVVKLISTFQSRSRIFFLTEFLPGGELFHLLTKREVIP